MTVFHLFLLVSFIAEIRSQNNCADYYVSVRQVGFLIGKDVTLLCRYQGHNQGQDQDPYAISMAWDAWSGPRRTGQLERGVYSNFSLFPDHTTSRDPRLEGKTIGPHTLSVTLHATTPSDNLRLWSCRVDTLDCRSLIDTPKPEAAVVMVLTEPYFEGVTMLFDGESPPGGSGSFSKELRPGNDRIQITCTTLSDPKTDLEIVGAPGSTAMSPASCEPLGDSSSRWSSWPGSYGWQEKPPQPFSCTAMTVITTLGRFDVFCKASWNGEERRSQTYQISFYSPGGGTAAWQSPRPTYSPNAPGQSGPSNMKHDFIFSWLWFLSVFISYVVN